MYLVTNHFYPLIEKEKTPFFGGIWFDNPSTKEEIRHVARLIKDANFSTKRPFPEETFQVGEGFLTLRGILDEFIENHVDDNRAIMGKPTKNIYVDLAKLWVIIRFDESIIEMTDSISQVDFNLKDNDVFRLESKTFQCYEFVKSRMAFLDFMINDSILASVLFRDADEITSHSQSRLFPELIVRSHKNEKADENQRPSTFLPFNKVYKKYYNVISKINDRYRTQKFNFICNSLFTLSNIYFISYDLYNLQLISIIEFLLTHKPDTNRYNVEDSITKQFAGKLNLVLYESLSVQHNDQIEKELKYAYSIRSDIAHGDYNDKTKQIALLAKFYDLKVANSSTSIDLESETINRLNSNLESYVKIVLQLYLNDERKLEYLKKI